MTDEEKIQRAKNIAAQKAFETYGDTLQKLLEEEGITDMIGAVVDSTHIHEAVLFVEKKTCVVTCRWEFSGHPAKIEKALLSVKTEGQA